ncbi:Mur ligase domain-containing protein [Pontiella sulfatireligans]|uniref:UDP-N-acetylmuramate--L-alanine ligase n=1 Tax=Pontiella sulfatireligans TaxID=2750658 RepID=A0A6C2UFK2_9BACT|nr:Mur ligase domain-containing protein [Pontiella sulfatireligans]VGO18888.1 UDP-N-acetylmuramate--L-alanine ligase [Pontiella sulfatireligans]
MERIHFIGIGGVGMNGLAQLAAQSGFEVTGSDRAYSPDAEIFQGLENLGIIISDQDGSGITENTNAVVFSTAIESNNPDLQQSRSLNIPLLHRSIFLKELVGDGELIAVAGTAGKTTTTGLLGWIFESLGKDPSVYNGASVLNWKTPSTPGNVRKGSSSLWIIEADESDKSFLAFHPTHTIITNIFKDHYELDELHALFDQFECQTSGITIRGPVAANIDLTVPMLGKHNHENARCAEALCAKLGLDMGLVRDAIAQFKGIERRLEIAGEAGGATVLDDYAHNPAKIEASLSAVAEAYGTVHAFWRPHGFTPLFQGMDELVKAFSLHWNKNGGSIMILPVYYAGGTVDRKTSSEELVARLNARDVPALLVPDYTILKTELEQRAKPGEAILGMGARDPELPLFAKRLVAEWKMP